MYVCKSLIKLINLLVCYDTITNIYVPFRKMYSMYLFCFYFTMNNLEVKAVLNKYHTADNFTFFLKTLVKSYAEHYNYPFKFLSFSDLDNLSTVDMMLVDAGMYANVNPNPFVLTSVVPFYSMTLVVSTLHKQDKSEYFALPFDAAIWIVCMIFPIYFAVVLEISPRKSNFTVNLLEAFRVITTGSIRLPKLDRLPWRVMYFLVIAYAFIMSMLYTSYLGCLLAKPLGKVDFSFMCPVSRRELLELNTKYKNIKLLNVADNEYFTKMYGLDLNYGYCMTSLFYKNVIGFQKMAEPIFRPVIPWKFVYGHYLRMNKHSKHVKEFNNFLINTYSSGLMKKWETEMLVNVGNIRRFIVYDNNILTFHDLLGPFMLYGCCLFVSTMAFLAEIFYERAKKLIGKKQTRKN